MQRNEIVAINITHKSEEIVLFMNGKIRVRQAHGIGFRRISRDKTGLRAAINKMNIVNFIDIRSEQTNHILHLQISGLFEVKTPFSFKDTKSAYVLTPIGPVWTDIKYEDSIEAYRRKMTNVDKK